jgi:hypothetical protein
MSTKPPRSRPRIARCAAALAVAPLFVLGACGSSGSSGGQPPRAYGAVKPSSFVYTGDSTGEFTGVTWTSWGGAVARGSGELVTDDCRPDCASGTRHNQGHADIELTQLTGGRYTLLRITSGPAALRGEFPVAGG